MLFSPLNQEIGVMARTTRAAIVLLAALIGGPSQAAAQANIAGVWEVTLNSPTGPTTVDVTFKQDGEAITGELVSLAGTATFKGKLVENTLSVNAPVEIQGNQIVLVFIGKVADDAMTGNVKFGDFGEADWTAKRKPAGAAAASAPAATTGSSAASTAAATTTAAEGVAGKWDIVVNLPGNPLPFTAVLKQDGTAVSGTMSGVPGELPVTGTMAGNILKLDFSGPGGMSVTMTGELKGDSLAGKTTIAGVGETDWTGKRAN
jgi:hypothetical protein